LHGRIFRKRVGKFQKDLQPKGLGDALMSLFYPRLRYFKRDGKELIMKKEFRTLYLSGLWDRIGDFKRVAWGSK
jgi:hypothetical protein